MFKRFVLPLIVVGLIAVLACGAFAQTAVLREAPDISLPTGADCNNPTHWDGDTYYVFNSGGQPTMSSGTSQFNFTERGLSYKWDNEINGKRWIEATWRMADGTIYGWYHNEPHGLCPGTRLTAPRIGAAVSKDNGANWHDLGIILEARPGLECKAKNGFFAGGNGDFSIMPDKDRKYLYIYFSAYTGSVVEQGVTVARMLWKDRDNPVGKVWKWHNGKWDQPGIGGLLTPIFPGTVDWKRYNAEAFWGPSIHWNTYLQKYVILLNRTAYRPGWPQEGIYVTYSSDVSDPTSWTTPEKILQDGHWYPQILGISKERGETDKLAGQQARFYMHGHSNREIIFFRDGEDTSKLPPVYVPE